MVQLLTGFAIDFGPNEIMNTDGMNVTFMLPHYGIVLQHHGFVIGQYSPTILYCYVILNEIFIYCCLFD